MSQSGNKINMTDIQGKKYGQWIKKYPNQAVMYEGYFKDDHPVGEFKRFYENTSLKSLLIYSDDGKDANATLYHTNGHISAKGKYLNQKKEGKWQFFSEYIEGYLITEEYYSADMKNGPSIKYYTNNSIAEKINYVNNIKQGEWIQYYTDGKICLKSNYKDGKIDGKFEVWFENGKPEITGQYKNDKRDGSWNIYNTDGTIKYKLDYINGITDNRQIDLDGSDYLDSLEKNKGRIPDPEKTGSPW